MNNGILLFYIALGILAIFLLLMALPTLIAREKRRLEKRDKKRK